MASPFLFFSGEPLSAAELTSACLDGHLVALGEGFMHADAVETRWMRAASLRPLLSDYLAATRLTAAWVHGALPLEPPRHDVQRATSRRLPGMRGRRFVYRDMQLGTADSEMIAGVHVTTVGRTLADLARSDDPEHQRFAREWSRTDDDARARALAWVRTHARYPGTRRAAVLLTEASETPSTDTAPGGGA